MKKRCSKCGEWKEVGEFREYRKTCRHCEAVQSSEYRIINRHKYSVIAKKSREKHKSKRNLEHRKYYLEHAVRLKDAARVRAKAAWNELVDYRVRVELKKWGLLNPTAEEIETKRLFIMRRRLIKKALRRTNESTGD